MNLVHWLGHGWLAAGMGIAFNLFATLACVWQRRRARRSRAVAASPRANDLGITVLKPLCGYDEDLEANLESFARQTWRPLQIVIGSIEPNERALSIARRVRDRHRCQRNSGLEIIVVVEPAPLVGNPKVQTLAVLDRWAKYDHVMISDSNVRAGPNDLQCLMAAFDDPCVAMSYQPVIGEGEETVAAALENLKLTDQAGTMLSFVTQTLCHDVVMGKGILIRRAALESIGGWLALLDIAAEDYMLGQLLTQAGWKLALAQVPARAVHHRWSWSGLFNRATRHAALRFRLVPWLYWIEWLVNPVALTAIVALYAGSAALPALAVAVGYRIISDSLMVRYWRGRGIAWQYALLAPVKDLLLAICWVAGILVRQISWRNHPLKLGWGTKLQPANVLNPMSHEFGQPQLGLHNRPIREFGSE